MSSPAFSLRFDDGSETASSSMKSSRPPQIESLAPALHATRYADHENGRAVAASFEDSQHRIRATWRAILRDGSHYIRQELTLRSIQKIEQVSEIVLLTFNLAGAEVVGSVKGSPVTFGNWFCGFEHPLSQSSVEGNQVRCSLQRQLPLEHGHSASYSSVIGVTEPGQTRRGFLRYIERERAHPYRPFLHYNSWYDLGYFTPYDEAGALDVIRAFGAELHGKRGVTLDSFLFDDGWDNHKSLWHFNSGFPRGFTPLKKAAAEFGAAPGVWLSPWGGYDGPRKERLDYGKQQGFEENSEGFVLSGPRYFKRFRDACMKMIRSYGVNQFKFDGTGNASTVYPGSKFNSDFDAMISLIGDLRKREPDLYVNLTTGTYPSPFWLRNADSIWRGGDDHSFAGVGSDRQQWITYRDADTYEHVVRRGPHFPLNSLMLHGLIYARHAEKLNVDPSRDFPAEVRSYFGTGTQLQEMYITHSLLADADWDALAEAAQWSRRNADILVDTHWIGGDPAKLEVYGWASWSPRGGIITMRNPDKLPHEFDLDPQRAFELPADAAANYVARSPWKDSARTPGIPLRADRPFTIRLAPLEVLTLEAAPQ
ncbi:MAG TPA: enterotoxin [Candidatus Acidoferrales bacterium]|nr:enterotoxin [Candidatus Acidoferrales bacterium]